MTIQQSWSSLQTRVRSPFWQNFIVGILVGVTGGLYAALNLLGAGGGKPTSASTINTANAILCGVYAVSALLAGSVLNKLGPALTAFFGVIGYILYISSLWYFDQKGNPIFPYVAAVCIGTSAGLIFVTQGYISMSYSEEKERGLYVTIALNLQALGTGIGGLIPLIINRNRSVSAGVPPSVYIALICMDVVGACLAFLLTSPKNVIRKDGTDVAHVKSRTFFEELRGCFDAIKDWKMLLLIPAFLPGQVFLVYNGSVNVYRNTLRARSLLSFCAVVVQILIGFVLQWILDHPKLKRRTRAICGLCFIGIPLIGAWVWECIRVRNYNRSDPPTPIDWDDKAFAPIFILFMMNSAFSTIFQYIIMYFLGCFTNNPRLAANNAGVFRGITAAGEAITFGADSRGLSYSIESGVILAFYTLGSLMLGYLALFVIEESNYFKEDEVTVPEHVKREYCRPENEKVAIEADEISEVEA